MRYKLNLYVYFRRLSVLIEWRHCLWSHFAGLYLLSLYFW